MEQHQNDLVVAIAKKGAQQRYLDKVSFPKKFNIGARTKEKMGKAFSFICDPQELVVQKKYGAFAHTVYYCNGIKFISTSEYSKNPGEKNTLPTTAMYVEKDDVRSMYECVEDGLYVLVYSKAADKVIDFIRCDVENDEKLSVKRLLQSNM